MPREFLQCTPVYILKPFFRSHLARVFEVFKGGIASAAESFGTGGKEERGTCVCWEKCSCPPIVQSLWEIVAAPGCEFCGNSCRLLVSDCFPPPAASFGEGWMVTGLVLNCGYFYRIWLGQGGPDRARIGIFAGSVSWSRQGLAEQKEKQVKWGLGRAWCYTTRKL